MTHLLKRRPQLVCADQAPAAWVRAVAAVLKSRLLPACAPAWRPAHVAAARPRGSGRGC